MKKLILIGRSESGKTSLKDALLGKRQQYHKTQYINREDWTIDTPGEYAANKLLARALALYSYEADIVGLLISADEPYSLFSPNITCMANREVIGIVTKIDLDDANPDRAENWLKLSGCKQVFRVSSVTGDGISQLFEYLSQKTEKN
ncbi:MAG: EutP/PduV family microcompartment system protein [bacterium]|nr:EutP/PduV family microcompartment system protein [bacterium]